METQRVTVTKSGGVADVRLSRPEKLPSRGAGELRAVGSSLEIDWPLSGDGTEKSELAITAALNKSEGLLTNLLIVLDGETRGDESLSMRSVRLDERISAFLLGEDALDGHGVGRVPVEPRLDLVAHDA